MQVIMVLPGQIFRPISTLETFFYIVITRETVNEGTLEEKESDTSGTAVKDIKDGGYNALGNTPLLSFLSSSR